MFKLFIPGGKPRKIQITGKDGYVSRLEEGKRRRREICIGQERAVKHLLAVADICQFSVLIKFILMLNCS